MGHDEVLEKLKKLKDTGLKNKAIEGRFGLTENSLSNVLNGRKEVPKKYWEKILADGHTTEDDLPPVKEEYRKQPESNENELEFELEKLRAENLSLKKEIEELKKQKGLSMKDFLGGNSSGQRSNFQKDLNKKKNGI